MISRKDLDLLARDLDGGLAPAEQRRIGALLAVSEEARDEKRAMLETRRHVKASALAIDGFDDSFVDDTVARLRYGDARDGRETARVYRLTLAGPLRYAVAASVAILAIALAIVIIVGRSGGPEQLPVRVVELADGSRVSLAVGASLDLPDEFSEERRVRLNGEAFFEVVSTGDPFVVEVKHGEIVVTGTSFNVRAWDVGPDFTEVVLVEGSVEVHDESGVPVRLAPGQVFRLRDGANGSPASADLKHVVAWRSSGFGFQHETLDVVFAEVARRYATEITLSSDVDVARRLTYLSQRPGSLTSVLSDLCHAVNLRFSPTRSGYEIHAP